jgi:hypothetical protein
MRAYSKSTLTLTPSGVYENPLSLRRAVSLRNAKSSSEKYYGQEPTPESTRKKVQVDIVVSVRVQSSNASNGLGFSHGLASSIIALRTPMYCIIKRAHTKNTEPKNCTTPQHQPVHIQNNHHTCADPLEKKADKRSVEHKQLANRNVNRLKRSVLYNVHLLGVC